MEQYGYGQLTPRGEYRGYQIGQFIRRQYSSLLSPKYNRSEIYIRSTDVTRTKMTILNALTAIYSSTEANKSQDVNWTPVLYTTQKIQDDFMMPFANCPEYMLYMTRYKPEFPQFQDVLEKWSLITGIDFANSPQLVYITYDSYACQHSLDIPLDDALEEIFTEIEAVANAVNEAIFGNEHYLPLLSGVLLNEFFKASSATIDGRDTPRVRIYSGHDINVYGLIAASKVKLEARPGVPKYGAIFALELRRVVQTGQYVVLLTYVPDPDKNEILYLPIEGCDDIFCDFEYFKNITSQFLLDENRHKEACQLKLKVPNWFSS